MEDYNKQLFKVEVQNGYRLSEQFNFKINSIPSTEYLQQRYGMGWHDAMNVQQQISKQTQKVT